MIKQTTTHQLYLVLSFLLDIVPATPLKKGTEVIFLVDSSTNVSDNIYAKEKEFVQKLAENFNISPKGPRGSAVIYGSDPFTVARFGEHDFHGRVARASLLKTPRRIDKALEQAANMFSASGSGSNNRKIVVLLTTGKQTHKGKSLSEAIEPLRRLGAQTFVVAIGPEANSQELGHIAKHRQDIFPVASHNDLSSRAKSTSTYIRDKPGTVTFLPLTFKTVTAKH